MVNIFTQTCPNRVGVGAIDNPDRVEDVFDPYYILEVLQKIFKHDISILRPQKLVKNGLFSSCKGYSKGNCL